MNNFSDAKHLVNESQLSSAINVIESGNKMKMDTTQDKQKKLKVVSLFSGCGGMDLGFVGGFKHRHYEFKKTGFELVFSNDFDAHATRVYQANQKYLGGHSFHAGDVTKIPNEDIPDFDILLAGFPCQPFSNAGNRQGINDKSGRGTLFYECERILKHNIEKANGKLPMAFVFENVRGIISSKMPDGQTVPEEISRRMSALGFKITMKLLRSSDYGVPQNRYRFIIVGVRNDIKEFDFSEMDEIVNKYGLPSINGDQYELTLGAILSDIPKTALHASEYWKYSPGSQSMVDMIGPCLNGAEALPKFKKKVLLEKISPTIKQGRSWKNIPPENLSPRFKKIYDNPEVYHAPNFYRRFALGEIAGTITASAQPENCGITHPFENRRMSIREIARVQSFPDDFNFSCSTIAGSYKVIGNAVPPVFGWVIAMALQSHLSKHVSA
jgi:DNA (cytosine-5)-methyltransferase 1